MATQLKTLDSHALANLSRLLVGADQLFSARLVNSAPSNYPPHNVVKYSENQYAIEVAVAGFNKNDISIQVDQNVLTIKGNHAQSVTDINIEYLHRGLAARNFVIEFPLAEYMHVQEAEVKDGMLKISLEYIVPDALKPRQINIK